MLAKVEFTTRCNLECIHCCASIYRPARDWKTDQLRSVLNQLIDEGYTSFELKGGEPFIRSDTFEMMDLLEQHGAGFFVSSNSLLLNEENIQKLLSYNGLSTLSISLDGSKRETHEAMRGENTFDHTIKVIQLAATWKSKLNSRVRLALNYTLTKINHKEIGDIFTLVHTLGFDAVFVLSLSMLGNAVEHRNELFLPEREELLALQKGTTTLRKINIARQVKGLNPLEFDMELVPYLWKCRLMKWSRNFTGGGADHKCGSGIHEVYIGADGTIFPCEGIRIFQDIIEREVGPYEKPNIAEYTIQEAKQTDSFRRVVEFLQDYDSIFTSLEPCNTCDYLRKCTVCPVFAMADGGMNRCMEEVLT